MKKLTVMAEKVAIRERLRDDTSIIEWLKKGDKVSFSGKDEDTLYSPGPIQHEYYRVTSSNGDTGFVRKDAFHEHIHHTTT